jgi:hypothetical protein
MAFDRQQTNRHNATAVLSFAGRFVPIKQRKWPGVEKKKILWSPTVKDRNAQVGPPESQDLRATSDRPSMPAVYCVWLQKLATL